MGNHGDDESHACNLRTGRVSHAIQPYHVTKCLGLLLGQTLASDAVAATVIESIRWHQVQAHAHLLSFVVMPDHVHWLFVLGESRSLSEVMEGFGKFTALRINRLWNRQGPLWQESFHDHAIRKARETALTVMAYIHNNPVRKGLCDRPESWPWSTANPKYEPWIEADWFW